MATTRYRIALSFLFTCVVPITPQKSSVADDGLSTLASAFFYAGARALLVSHWPVCNVIIKVTNSQEDVPIVHIELSDDGKGIKDEHKDKIFDPFFTTARDEGSRGLGLAIVKALLEAHGGSISLMSLGHGTSFQITLPSRLS